MHDLLVMHDLYEFYEAGYLIYHPSRAVATFDATTIYHDHIGGNQDPFPVK